MPICEICGREVQSTRAISIEGAQLQACNRCAPLGEPIRTPKTSAPASVSPRTRIQSSTPIPRQSPTRTRRPQRELVPVENFSQLIRTAREQLGISQQEVARRINERSSIIGKLESGKMSVCTIQLARKLERLFKLTLLEESEPLDLSFGPASSTTTIGDVVEVKRKRQPSENAE